MPQKGARAPAWAPASFIDIWTPLVLLPFARSCFSSIWRMGAINLCFSDSLNNIFVFRLVSSRLNKQTFSQLSEGKASKCDRNLCFKQMLVMFVVCSIMLNAF